MEMGNLITIGVFVATQVGTLIWTVATIRGDARGIRAEMGFMQRELDRITKVLEQVADARSDMQLIQERGLAQGKRLDDLSQRLNRFLDERPAA